MMMIRIRIKWLMMLTSGPPDTPSPQSWSPTSWPWRPRSPWPAWSRPQTSTCSWCSPRGRPWSPTTPPSCPRWTRLPPWWRCSEPCSGGVLLARTQQTTMVQHTRESVSKWLLSCVDKGQISTQSQSPALVVATHGRPDQGSQGQY